MVTFHHRKIFIQGLLVLAIALATLSCGDQPEETPHCTPQVSCEAVEAECGEVSDGCGGVLDCGECSAPLDCSPSNQCEEELCEPKTCADLGATCGTVEDGCGGQLDCGECSGSDTCGGGGVANQCGCEPTSCELAGAECGTIPDGCGGELDCGDCEEEPEDLCEQPSVQPPEGWTRLTTGTFSCLFRAGVGIDFDADCSTWEGIWNLPFPGGNGLPQRLGIGRFSPEEYLAIGFNTEGLPQDKKIDIRHTGPGSGVQVTQRLATISACPGNFDFDAVEEETGCVFDLTLLISRIHIGGIDTDEDCRLDPDSDYYLNIIHTDSSLDTSVNDLESNCPPDTFCGVLYNPTSPE